MSGKKKPQRQLSFVDLFAGCGGLSLGLEMAGWHPVFVNELNKDALKTYLLNRKHLGSALADEFHINDVKALVKDDGALLTQLAAGLKRDQDVDVAKGELDLVVGGPPCQGFSGIGHRRSYSVHKKQLPSNHLYQDMVFVISKLRPKMFLFENVRGLLAARWDAKGYKGQVWDTILSEFRQLDGYRVHWKLVYAKDYGVPQNRPRVLMVGVRDDAGVRVNWEAADAVQAGLLPEGAGGAPDLVDLLGDLVERPVNYGGATTHYPRKPFAEIQERLRQAPPKGLPPLGRDEVTEQEYSNHSPAIRKKFAFMLAHGGRIPPSMQTKKFAQRVLRPRWGPGGPTITAASLADDYVHFELPRSLTVREWARLQMFPDWYQFAGKRTTGGLRRAGNPRAGIFDREVPKYTQIGNAVPVELAKAVGKHFAALIKGARKGA